MGSGPGFSVRSILKCSPRRLASSDGSDGMLYALSLNPSRRRGPTITGPSAPAVPVCEPRWHFRCHCGFTVKPSGQH